MSLFQALTVTFRILKAISILPPCSCIIAFEKMRSKIPYYKAMFLKNCETYVTSVCTQTVVMGRTERVPKWHRNCHFSFCSERGRFFLQPQQRTAMLLWWIEWRNLVSWTWRHMSQRTGRKKKQMNLVSTSSVDKNEQLLEITVDERRIGWWFLFPFNNENVAMQKTKPDTHCVHYAAQLCLYLMTDVNMFKAETSFFIDVFLEYTS